MAHLPDSIIVEFIIVAVLIKLVHGETFPSTTTETKSTKLPSEMEDSKPVRPGRPLVNNSIFLEIWSISDIAEVVRRRPWEYIFVHQNLSFEKAWMACRHIYDGNLVVINDRILSQFLARVLSETNKKYDTVWTAGRKEKVMRKSDEIDWVWIRYNTNYHKLVNKSLLNETTAFGQGTKDCLGFGRSDHDTPQFRPTDCNAARSYICQRPQGAGVGPSWIRIGSREYRIYNDVVPYEVGRTKCFFHDTRADLAVIPDYDTASKLIEYLLMGRPSYENVWIGGKRKKDHFVFEPEDLELSDTKDKDNFPPWADEKISKKAGCLMLDRHEEEIVTFEPTDCDSMCAILCYRKVFNATRIDVIFDDWGYRLYLKELPWEEARTQCDSYKEYSAKLAEIDTETQLKQLLYVMGGNYSYVQHIWLGGLYENGKWFWNSTGSIVSNELMHWVKNTSYEDDVEHQNTCLNMDRENLVTPLHYGTVCRYKQYFVCVFPADELKKLQKEEGSSTIKE